jgi:hypothetical protein
MKSAKHSKATANIVEFALGAQVLATQNLDVDMDVTNGAREEIVSEVAS